MSESPRAFEGKVAMVTGAAGGIGAATAEALARSGADVAVNDLSFSENYLESLRSTGRRVLPLVADVSDQSAVEKMVERTALELGRIDYLVTSAVYSDREPFTTADMAGFRKTIDVSFWGSFYALRATANAMIRCGEGGAVVIVSSPHAKVAYPNCMAYNIAKAAQDMMANSAALELLPHRIRVNVVHPGWTDTPGERKFFREDDLRKVGPTLPGRRLARPSEIARAVLFLLHPESEYVNGVTLTVDGGLSLPWWSKRGTGNL